jgi:predicted ribosomally synthesized peptide with nif11-like leader|tara:strand:+ start:254 stop:595 length:342 start_codon:yes stop_codon:yes gene_type:complete
MSQQALEEFMEKVGSNMALADMLRNQLDSDGNISADALIVLGAENGCEFTTEDLTQNVELSDEELDGVAGGLAKGEPYRLGSVGDGHWTLKAMPDGGKFGFGQKRVPTGGGTA